MRVPNAIFNYGLSSSSMRTYCAMLSLMGHKDKMQLKQSTIAKRAALSVRTVQRELGILSDKGLITIAKRYRWSYVGAPVKYLCSSYTLHKITGAYFNIDYKLISRADVSTSAFYCYAYLSKCMSATKRAFPSLNKIARAIGLSKPTIIAAIAMLQEVSLVFKKQYTRLCGCFGCNQYVLLEEANEVDYIGEVFLNEGIKKACASTVMETHTTQLDKFANVYSSILKATSSICQYISSHFTRFLLL